MNDTGSFGMSLSIELRSANC